MSFHIFGLVGILTITALGCGEVDTLVLPIRPSQQDLPAAQAALRTAGCSGPGSGCHTALTGDLQISPEPKSPAVLEAEYTQIKRFISLSQPSSSLLLRVALRDAPESDGHTICFDSEDNCAYRKVVAWIEASGPNDPGPDDIDCVVQELSCFQ